MEEYELYRDLNMLPQVITYNVEDDGKFRDDLPFFGGHYILSRKGGEGTANKAVIDRETETVPVIYLAGENPDDVRARFPQFRVDDILQ